LTLDEIKSLFLFSFLGECVAGIALANEIGLGELKILLNVLILKMCKLFKLIKQYLVASKVAKLQGTITKVQ